MDTRILRYYEKELAFMRDMGAEFAENYPKIASRLGIGKTEVYDPYIERLMEGVAFLAARVNLEHELQFSALSNHLLEIIYPHYLAPLPSMMIAAFEPDPKNSSISSGYLIPRHSVLKSQIVEGCQMPCIFRTAWDLTLWPIEIREAEFIETRSDLIGAALSRDSKIRTAIRLRLGRCGSGKISDLAIDRLPLFLEDQKNSGWLLHEILCTTSESLIARSTDRRNDWFQILPDSGVFPIGYKPEEAILPKPRQSFDGYRLLQEYFGMPEKFRFVELRGLSRAFARTAEDEIDIYILLKGHHPRIAPFVQPSSFRLHAVPAINLFPKQCDHSPIPLSDSRIQIIPDRTALFEFEIHSFMNVRGIGVTVDQDLEFSPFYSADEFTAAGNRQPAYYTLERVARNRSEKERLKGLRTSYTGSDVYVTLVDRNQTPYNPSIEQIAVTAMVTNRDLPILLGSGAKDIFYLSEGGPVLHISTPLPPVRPRSMLAQGEISWHLISHLSLNYLSIGGGGKDGAEGIREILGTYAPSGDKIIEKQLEGIRSVHSRPIVRRISDDILSTAVRGLEISVTIDESLFEGSSAYLLVSVLAEFFRKYVSINSFVETVMMTQQRGEIARWRPQIGMRKLL